MTLCMAAGDPPADTKPDDAVKAIRTAGQEFQTCIASLEDILEEPLKSKFAEVKNQINKMLAGLPETDKVPAAMASNDVLRSLLGVLSSAQFMISGLQEAAKSNAKAMASTKAALPGEVTAAIDAKVKAGDFIPKAEHEQKLNDAVTAATTAARAAATAEIQLVGTRRQQLTTASIPVPGDDALTGEDKDFEAKKTAAAKRAEELKPFKLAQERVIALCWNTDEKAYQDTLALAKSAFEAAGKPGGANPFANRPANDNTATTKPKGLC